MPEQAAIDVIVICQHDAEMVKRCLASAKANAVNRVQLFVGVNARMDGTGADPDVFRAAKDKALGAYVELADKNWGFIRPNNELAKVGHSPYICLLNADTVCAPGWDEPLIRKLTTAVEYMEQPNIDYPRGRHETIPPPAIVGYSGGWLSSDGVGRHAAFPGTPVDYVEGWCLMTTRALWERLGGFDEAHLAMAYGEDSDLCLRAKELGFGVVAVENLMPPIQEPALLGGGYLRPDAPYVTHLRDVDGGKGASPETRDSDELQAAMIANHAYLRERHKAYLATERVLIKDYWDCSLAWEGGYEGEGTTEVTLTFGPQRDLKAVLRARKIDGRLWQLDIAGGTSLRLLVP